MSVNSKMTAIADAIRGKTGKTDSLTLDQMATEIATIETGGGGFPLEHEVTEYVHSEDWPNDDVLGLASHFAEVYCNGADTTDRALYICYIKNNTWAERPGTYLMSHRGSATAISGLNSRGGWNDAQIGNYNTRAFCISAGAIITVIKINTWGVEL